MTGKISKVTLAASATILSATALGLYFGRRFSWKQASLLGGTPPSLLFGCYGWRICREPTPPGPPGPPGPLGPPSRSSAPIRVPTPQPAIDPIPLPSTFLIEREDGSPPAKILILEGKIEEQESDVVVNAANSTIRGGSGVDAAIHQAGGMKDGKNIIDEACVEVLKTREGKLLADGESVITTAGEMRATWCVHTVGPHGSALKKKKKLASAYQTSLEIAMAQEVPIKEEEGAVRKVQTISFPLVSTGVFGFPRGKAALIATTTIRDFLKEHSQLTEVRIVIFRDSYFNENRCAYAAAVKKLELTALA